MYDYLSHCCGAFLIRKRLRLTHHRLCRLIRFPQKVILRRVLTLFCHFFLGHVFKCAKAQVAKSSREILSSERKLCSSPDPGPQELAIQQRILSYARSGNYFMRPWSLSIWLVIVFVQDFFSKVGPICGTLFWQPCMVYISISITHELFYIL